MSLLVRFANEILSFHLKFGYFHVSQLLPVMNLSHPTILHSLQSSQIQIMKAINAAVARRSCQQRPGLEARTTLEGPLHQILSSSTVGKKRRR